MEALANNQDLQLAISRVCEYYASYRIARAPMLPFVDLNGTMDRMHSSSNSPIGIVPGINPTNNDFLLLMSLNWELDSWGRISSATAAACAELLAQTEARRAVVLTVVSAVAKGYFVLRGLDKQLDISKKTLTSRLDSLKLAKDRFELGETSEIEVKQAEAEVESAAIRMIEFERAIPIQENLISVLVGATPHEILRGRDLEAFPLEMEVPTGLPSDLLTRRPDIMQAEDQLIAANARISETRAAFFPQISLTGDYGYLSTKLSEWLTNPAMMWAYGISLLQPVFHNGQVYFTWEKAVAVWNEAIHNYCQVILKAFKEVEDSLIAYQKNLQLVRQHKIQVKVLKDYLHLAQLRYEEGEIDYLNVLDAERLLFDAQLAQAQAQVDSLNAVVALYAAVARPRREVG